MTLSPSQNRITKKLPFLSPIRAPGELCSTPGTFTRTSSIVRGSRERTATCRRHCPRASWSLHWRQCMPVRRSSAGSAARAVPSDSIGPAGAKGSAIESRRSWPSSRRARAMRESFGHGPITHRRMCSTGNSGRVVRLDWCDGRPIRGLQDCWGGATKASDPSTTLIPGKGAHRRLSLGAALGDGGKTPPWSTSADTEGPAELVWLARHAVYGLA